MRALLAAALALALVAAGITAAASPATALSIDRIAGSDRYATSVEVSRNLGDITGGVVFLASGLKFPDALSAAPVVAVEGGDLLLTGASELPASVAERIRELAPAEIVVVGSTASISDAVLERAVEVAQADDEQVVTGTRIGGSNRVETSLLLLERLRESGPVESAWVVSGANFPDALVAASVAGRYGAAVILDYHAADSAATQAWLDQVGPQLRGVGLQIAGGESSVSEIDIDGLERAGAAWSTRYAGRDRYETAAMINQSTYDANSTTHILLATGQNFPDALAGAVLSATAHVPMYLTPQACHPAVRSLLLAETNRLGTQTVVGLGSGATLNDQALMLTPCATSLQQQIGQVYGTFPAQRYTGSGPHVIDLGRQIPYAQVVANVRSSDRVVLNTLDSSRRHIDAIGSGWRSYTGTALIRPYSTSARYLQVRATGTWSLEVRDLTSAPILASAANGSQDAVYLYGGDGGTLRFTAELEGPLTRVDELWGNWQSSDPYRSGPVAGTGRLHAGPTVISVRSSSAWTLQVH